MVKQTNIDLSTEEGIEIYRHSTSHVMAAAVKLLYPSAKLGIGPAISNGFYYDFDLPQPLTPEDLQEIEEKMHEIIKLDLPFVREEISREEAKKIFSKLGEIYKLELLEEITDDIVSIYRTGDFVDLCRGPHMPSTGHTRAFKLLEVAGAYWRGDEHNKMLQRIYGTAWPDKESLEQHLKNIKEAERRDHRRLGKELGLFSVHEAGGPGLIYWHPKGACIRNIIENFWREEHIKRGYQIVYIPHIAKLGLWKESGHWEYYHENMYSPIDIDDQKYILKPMNCPGHILMYKTRTRSYRELPMRWAELGTVYRYERSGVLHGMLRVRGFTQDDAHIFCAPEQLKDEIKNVLELANYMMKTFGFEYKLFLSTRPDKYVGTIENWDRATQALEGALKQQGLKYDVDPGAGIFYGPKIDVSMIDALGRGWQGPTIQVDFNLPERFNVNYIGTDGREHRPVMVHRTVLGSMERFIGVLIEHYGGAFPPWLAPVQVRVLTITSDQIDYAARIKEKLLQEGFRAELNTSPEKINAKIRDTELAKVPYMAIVGDKEVKQNTLSIRKHRAGDQGSCKIDEFINRLKKEVEERE